MKKTIRIIISVAVALLTVAALFSCDSGEGPVVPIEPEPDYYFARGEKKEFVPTGHYPEDDLVIGSRNVMNFGAKADGVTDDSEAFNKAIAAAEIIGGGVVYVPAGRYYVPEQINIPSNVTLCGDWVSPDKEPAGTRGTIILTDYKGKTTQSFYSFIKLNASAGLRNLTVYYTNQNASEPVAMAPTIFAGGTSCQVTIENVTLVNSYYGISIGEAQNTACGLASITNVYMTALYRGALLNHSADCSRFENVSISPDYWNGNVISPLSDDEKNSVTEYCFKSCTGVLFYHGDATGMYGTSLHGLSVGIQLDDDPYGTGVTSGAITLTTIRDCNIGVLVNAAHGIGTALTGFRATADRACTAAVATGVSYTNNVKIEDGEISGKFKNAVSLSGGATLSLTDVEVSMNSNGYAVLAKAGVVSCAGCTFSSSRIFTDAGGTSAGYFYGCTFKKDVENYITSSSLFKKDDKAVEIKKISGYHVYKEQLPMPATKKIVCITDYGAVSDGKTDCTDAIQSALDYMKSQGGGIVLIPNGRYAIYGNLTVPAGVELSGTHGVWCYDAFALDGSCLLIYSGKNKPNGAAAISLEAGSGIRGFLAWYPEQDYDNFVKYSYAVRSLGPGTYAINVNIANAYQYMDFGSSDSTGHYVRNCAGIAIKTGMFIGKNSGEGWIENVHLNQHQPYELAIHNLTGGYSPDKFDELVFGTFIKTTEYFVFGYNENEHVLGAFGLGAKAVFRFEEQDGKATSGTFVQCGADGCTSSFVIEQAGELSIIAPGDVALGSAVSRTYFTTGADLTGTVSIHGGAGFGTPTNCIVIQGGNVNIQTFTFASGSGATPVMLMGGSGKVNLVNCVVPFSGDGTLSKTMKKFGGTVSETGTVRLGGKYGYEAFASVK
ncbi:MAG: hypothetical protein IKX86_01165 [Clostridia bacterium]|nr:hypothetical protein [Clostridia bacterium]